jgi:hypothetical protein
VFRILAALLALAGALATAPARAETVACGSFWQAKSGWSAQCESYAPPSPAAGARFFREAGTADTAAAILDLASEAFTASQAEYGKYGKLDPITFVAMAQNHPNYDPIGFQVWGLAEIDTRRPGESCLVMLFPAMGDAAADKVKQLVAHELFHCFQFDNMRGQVNGDPPPGVPAFWNDVTSWWVEGSAHYFSNLVYPAANLERNSQQDFDSNKAPFEQTKTGAYGTSLFFQSIARSLQPDGIVALLKSMPTAGNAQGQRAALAAEFRMNEAFHTFARDFIAMTIQDSDGSAIPIGFTGEDRKVDLQDGANTLAVRVAPFKIVTYTIALEKNRLYTFAGIGKAAGATDWKASYRVRGEWYEVYGDLIVDKRCGDDPATTVTLLLTRTANSDSADPPTDVGINVQEGDCPCKTTEPLPGCFVGRFALDNDSITGALDASVEKLKLDKILGSIGVEIGAGGQTKMTLTDWNPIWSLRTPNEDEVMQGLELILWGEFTGKIGKTDSGRFCVIPQTDKTTMQVDVIGPYFDIIQDYKYALTDPQGPPMASTEIDLNCDEAGITYFFQNAKGSYNGKLVRQP